MDIPVSKPALEIVRVVRPNVLRNAWYWLLRADEAFNFDPELNREQRMQQLEYEIAELKKADLSKANGPSENGAISR